MSSIRSSSEKGGQHGRTSGNERERTASFSSLFFQHGADPFRTGDQVELSCGVVSPCRMCIDNGDSEAYIHAGWQRYFRHIAGGWNWADFAGDSYLIGRESRGVLQKEIPMDFPRTPRRFRYENECWTCLDPACCCSVGIFFVCPTAREFAR